MQKLLHVPNLYRCARRFAIRLRPLLALTALLAFAALTAFAGMGAAIAATPAQFAIWSNVDWHPLLGKDWAPVGDGDTDFSGYEGLENLNFIGDVSNGPALYWAFAGGNVFFRIVLNGDPLKHPNSGSVVQKSELDSQVWSVLLQTTTDPASDYALTIDGAKDEIYTRCGSSFDALNVTGYSTSAGGAEGYVDGGYTYWLDGRVRVSHLATTYYLDMAAPLGWFTPSESGCGAAALIAEEPVAIGAATSADAENFNKDVLGAADLGTYFASVAQPVTLQLTASALNQSTLNVDSAYALHGDTLTYTITVKNTSAQALTPVLTNLLSAGVTYVTGSTALAGTALSDSGGASPIFSGYTLPTLQPGSSVVVTFQATVNTQGGDNIVLDDGDQIVDTATIAAGGVSYTTPEANGITQVIAPVVSLQINPATASFSPGEVITYTITASNTGHADAKTLRVEVPIPNDTVYLDGSAQSVAGTITEQHAADDPTSPVVSLEWVLPELNAQTSSNLSFRARVK